MFLKYKLAQTRMNNRVDFEDVFHLLATHGKVRSGYWPRGPLRQLVTLKVEVVFVVSSMSAKGRQLPK